MNGPEIYATVFALAPSFHDINTIWAGSDDGKIHITRNGGKNWADITPKDLPKHSVVAIIDESRHSAGTAYVAAFRYQVDDRQPYVFRTTDFGKTWTKIVSGIKDGHFARSVREDHVRPGLLFLGTEHGAYVSFNAGDTWQSLQINLPDTPIRDLVVKNDDVVLGTHGRGFWILDDINPLRQHSEAVAKQAVTLFQPSDAIRGVYDAVFQYYLKSKVDSVKLDILDASGSVVRSFVGTKAEEKPTAGDWWGVGEGKPTTAAGLNTFKWNLSYPGATVFDGIIIWGARPQNGPKAPIGKYQVRLTAGGVTQTYPFNVKINPNLKGVTEADLKETFDLAMKIRDKESAANEAVIRIRKIRAQAEERIKEANDATFTAQANEWIGKLTAIEEDLYQTKNRSGQDPLNFPIKLGNRLSAVRRSLETGDNKPTAGAYKVFDELSKELDGHLAKLESVIASCAEHVVKRQGHKRDYRFEKMSTRRKLLKSIALAPLALGGVSALAGTTTAMPAADDPDYWRKIRDQFLLAKDRVFFNPGTVGAMPRVVVEKVNEHMIKLATEVADWEYRGDKGWISGYYHMPEIREKIARLIHADAPSLALTDNVTSAMSYIAEGLTLKPGDEVITSNQEHGGGRSSWIVREKREGIRYREFELGKPIRDPQQVIDTIVKSFRPETRVLVLSHMITGSGALLPVKEICAEARQRGILTVLDGAQIIGQVALDVHDIGCDAYVGCFHKWIGAPPGTGFMWVRPEILKNLWTSVSSYQWNNHEDEGFRFTQRGTGNYSVLLGLEAALDFHFDIGPQRVYDRIKFLGNYLREGLRKMPKVKVFSPATETMCASITVYNVQGVTGAQLQDAFWNEARMRPRSQGDEFCVRHCTHIFNSKQELDTALRIVRKVAG